MQEVESICDRILVINNGKLVADDAITNEKSKTKTQTFEVEFDKKISLNKLQKISDVSKIEAKGESWIISSENENDLRIIISQFAAKNNLLILTLQKHSDNLEDIFKKLTK